MTANLSNQINILCDKVRRLEKSVRNSSCLSDSYKLGENIQDGSLVGVNINSKNEAELLNLVSGDSEPKFIWDNQFTFNSKIADNSEQTFNTMALTTDNSNNVFAITKNSYDTPGVQPSSLSPENINLTNNTNPLYLSKINATTGECNYIKAFDTDLSDNTVVIFQSGNVVTDDIYVYCLLNVSTSAMITGLQLLYDGNPFITMNINSEDVSIPIFVKILKSNGLFVKAIQLTTTYSASTLFNRTPYHFSVIIKFPLLIDKLNNKLIFALNCNQSPAYPLFNIPIITNSSILLGKIDLGTFSYESGSMKIFQSDGTNPFDLLIFDMIKVNNDFYISCICRENITFGTLSPITDSNSKAIIVKLDSSFTPTDQLYFYQSNNSSSSNFFYPIKLTYLNNKLYLSLSYDDNTSSTFISDKSAIPSFSSFILLFDSFSTISLLFELSSDLSSILNYIQLDNSVDSLLYVNDMIVLNERLVLSTTHYGKTFVLDGTTLEGYGLPIITMDGAIGAFNYHEIIMDTNFNIISVNTTKSLENFYNFIAGLDLTLVALYGDIRIHSLPVSYTAQLPNNTILQNTYNIFFAIGAVFINSLITDWVIFGYLENGGVKDSSRSICIIGRITVPKVFQPLEVGKVYYLNVGFGISTTVSNVALGYAVSTTDLFLFGPTGNTLNNLV